MLTKLDFSETTAPDFPKLNENVLIIGTFANQIVSIHRIRERIEQCLSSAIHTLG